jgi:hypothetical protein
MTLELMRKLFWLLLFLEALSFIFLDHAALTLLRIGEFGAKDNSEMWQVAKLMAEFALCITYLAGVVIALRSRKLLQIHSMPERFLCLALATSWPVIIFVTYGVLVGYAAS